MLANQRLSDAGYVTRLPSQTIQPYFRSGDVEIKGDEHSEAELFVGIDFVGYMWLPYHQL